MSQNAASAPLKSAGATVRAGRNTPVGKSSHLSDNAVRLGAIRSLRFRLARTAATVWTDNGDSPSFRNDADADPSHGSSPRSTPGRRTLR